MAASRWTMVGSRTTTTRASGFSTAATLDRVPSSTNQPSIPSIERQLIEIVENHRDRGESRIVLTLELGAEDELASDDDIGRELEIGGRARGPLVRGCR